ncbi:unnamed protein product [Musa banksii]
MEITCMSPCLNYDDDGRHNPRSSLDESFRCLGGEVVERVAASPDLALAARLHPKHAELLHGVREVREKSGLVGGVELHEGLRLRVRRQRLVRRQQPQPPQQVLVVQVVELARRHHVVEGGDGRVRGVVGTRLLQRLRELRVHRRVVGVLVAAVVAVDARRELVAVREADGVGAGEGHQLLCGEALPSEEGDELVHGHVGAGELALDGGGGGVEGVLAAEADVVERPAQHDDELAGGEGEDVGAGDHAGALKLEGCLGADDDVEAVPGERDVVVGVALRAVEGVGRHEHGGVAAAGEAVVEEEAEGAGGCDGGGDLLGRHHLRHDLLRLGARLLVVGGGELGGGRGREEEDGNQSRDPCHQGTSLHVYLPSSPPLLILFLLLFLSSMLYLNGMIR